METLAISFAHDAGAPFMPEHPKKSATKGVESLQHTALGLSCVGGGVEGRLLGTNEVHGSRMRPRLWVALGLIEAA